MGIYDQRNKSAYNLFKAEPHYAKNQHILTWWTPAHDEILAEHIARLQWAWYLFVTDEIVRITPAEHLDGWRKFDPTCARYAWYNVLIYFAAARADQLGLTKAIRPPVWKTCPLCKQRFVEDSLPAPLVARLGINKLDFCAPCLRDTVFQGSGDDHASAENIIHYLQALAALIERVPTQNFGEGKTDLLDLDTAKRLALLKLFQSKPTMQCVETVFGSWLNALIQAGVLEDGTRRTSRGIQTIAKDGHVCLSLGEKTIDDFLYAHNISHEKEPHYPEGNYRADFRVGDAFIEYFGLTGDPEYDSKTKGKISICRKHKITLVALYPRDLISHAELEGKLFPLFPDRSLTDTMA